MVPRPPARLALLGIAATLVAGWCLRGEDAAKAAPQSPPPRVNIVPRDANLGGPSLDAPRSNIRVDTTLTLIPVTVTDPLNRVVTGLDKEHFRVTEDNVEQAILHFTSEDSALSAGIVFDSSGSMGNKLQKSRQAVAEFAKTANPGDEFFLVQFNSSPQLTVGFTHETEEILNRITFTQSRGQTALLDAVYLALHEMRKAKNPRKALLVISDGGDNNSRYTPGEVKNLVREADVQIYGIGIFEPLGNRGRTAEELNGPSLLSEIAEQTGGRAYPVENLNDLPDIAAKIGIELRNQYIIGYSSTNKERDGKYRRVRVRVVQPRGFPPLRAFWRLGYYAPSQ